MLVCTDVIPKQIQFIFYQIKKKIYKNLVTIQLSPLCFSVYVFLGERKIMAKLRGTD
jgi:hypothetical protein